MSEQPPKLPDSYVGRHRSKDQVSRVVISMYTGRHRADISRVSLDEILDRKH